VARGKHGHEPCVAGESKDSTYELAAAEVKEEELVGAAVGIGCF